jgi:cyanophycin synthetase
VVKRLKPVVIGDGQKTVADLIKDYNAGRLRPVPKDAETLRNLQKQGLNLDSVPKSGGKVVLRENSNFRTGGIAQDVTETVAKEYFAIAEKAAELIGIRLCGVDLLIPQTAVFSDYCLTEVNSVPGFDVHLEPSVGPSRPEILGKVWDAIFTKE